MLPFSAVALQPWRFIHIQCRLVPIAGGGTASVCFTLVCYRWGEGTLNVLFFRSGSHRQLKRPKGSLTIQTEEPPGALTPLSPGESDQCPGESPCRLQPGYEQPGLFQGKLETILTYRRSCKHAHTCPYAEREREREQ